MKDRASARHERRPSRPSAAGRHERGPRRWLSVLGPGLITGASDDDPSGIATYTQAGAQFGYDTGWSMLFTYPLMSAIQEISARIGRVTGHGIAGNLRAHYSPSIVNFMLALILIANVVNIGADLRAMADAIVMLIGGWPSAYVVLIALLCAWLEIFSQYKRYVSILKWTTLSLFAYVATVLVVEVPWDVVLIRTLVPHLPWSKDYLLTVVAVLGTTISPYLFFWQSSQEAEDERIDRHARPLLKAPEQAPGEIRRIRIDTYLGMALSNLVGFCIIVTAAATLNAHGVTDINTSSEAAEVLRPIAGPFAFSLFALGIIGTGLLAVPVLAGSVAYALGESLRWRTGLARKPREAKAFYATIAFATLAGIAINFVDIDPMKALFWSAVANGIVAAPLMAMTMIVAMEPKVMGPFILPRPLQAMGWLSTAAMAASVVVLFASWVI